LTTSTNSANGAHNPSLASGRFRLLAPSAKHAAGSQAGRRARVSLPPSSCPRPASCAASILEWPNPAPATKLGQSRDEPPANSGRGVVTAADKGQACPEDVWRIARRVRSCRRREFDLRSGRGWSALPLFPHAGISAAKLYSTVRPAHSSRRKEALR